MIEFSPAGSGGWPAVVARTFKPEAGGTYTPGDPRADRPVGDRDEV